MLLFPEVKIKGLSADTGRHEILPQHTALHWNQSSKPTEEAGASIPISLHPQIPSQDAGRGRQLRASSLSQLDREEEINHISICTTGISFSK